MSGQTLTLGPVDETFAADAHLAVRIKPTADGRKFVYAHRDCPKCIDLARESLPDDEAPREPPRA